MAGNSFIDKLLHFIGWEEVEDDEDEGIDTPASRPNPVGGRPIRTNGKGAPRPSQSGPKSKPGNSHPTNVVNFPQENKRQRTVIYRLHSIEETRNVITDLIENKTILLNLEELDEAYVQRANDILSGAAFALKATFLKTSHKVYLIAPPFVKVDNLNDYNG